MSNKMVYGMWLHDTIESILCHYVKILKHIFDMCWQCLLK